MVVDIPKDIQNWEGGIGSGSSLTGYRNRLETVINNNLNDELAKLLQILSKSKPSYAGDIINADVATRGSFRGL